MENYGYDGMLKMAWPFLILDLVLKGFSLWKSARTGQKWWFVVLLIVNSFGILPGIYLLLHRTKETKSLKSKKK